METNTPHHVHDCDQCIYLGSNKLAFDEEREQWDYYFCEKCDGGTLIARYGINGDYLSWPINLYKMNRENILKQAPNYEIEKAYKLYEIYYKLVGSTI